MGEKSVKSSKSKSKKVYFISLPIILLMVAGLAIYFQYIAAKTPLKLCAQKFWQSVKEEDIAKIEVSSSTKKDITDKEKIHEIVEMLNSTTFKYNRKDEAMGYHARIVFYSDKNELLGYVAFTGDEFMKSWGRGYKLVSGTINVEDIKRFLE